VPYRKREFRFLNRFFLMLLLFVFVESSHGLDYAAASEVIVEPEQEITWGFSNDTSLECAPKDALSPNSPMNVFRGRFRKQLIDDELKFLIVRTEFPSTANSEKTSESHIPTVKKALDFLTSGRVEPMITNWEFISKVLLLDENSAAFKASDRNNLHQTADKVRQSQDRLTKEQDLKGIDVIILISPSNLSTRDKSSSIAVLSYGDYPSTVFLGSDFWISSKPWLLVAHELGHIFGLLDLYDFGNSLLVESGNQGYFSQFSFMGAFDIMNNPWGSSPELTVWNRWLLGTIQAGEIFCYSGKDASISLKPLALVTAGYRGIFINESDESLLVIENRQAIGFDSNSLPSTRGLLIYRVLLNVETGAGPLRLIKQGLCGQGKKARYELESLKIRCKKGLKRKILINLQG